MERSIWKFPLQIASRTPPFHSIDIPRPKAFPTHPRSIRKHHDLLFTHINPFGKLSANVSRREFIFFQTRSRLQVQTAANCPSPIKLRLHSDSTRGFRMFFIMHFFSLLYAVRLVRPKLAQHYSPRRPRFPQAATDTHGSAQSVPRQDRRERRGASANAGGGRRNW